MPEHWPQPSRTTSSKKAHGPQHLHLSAEAVVDADHLDIFAYTSAIRHARSISTITS